MGAIARGLLPLALCALATWSGAARDERQPPPAGIDPASLLESSAAESEFFVLLDPSGPEAEPLGVLRHVRLARGGVDWQVEQELLLHGPELRLHHLERYRGDAASLVFREQLRGASGRTIRAHWPLGGATPPFSAVERLREWEPSVVQWYGTRRTQRRFPGARGWQGALGLVERFRWGLVTESGVARLEVLSGLPELLRIEQRAGPASLAPSALAPRLVELRDATGAVRGAYLFLGTELLAITWQAGGAVAVRTTRERYDALAARHPLIRLSGVQGDEPVSGVETEARLQADVGTAPPTLGVAAGGG